MSEEKAMTQASGTSSGIRKRNPHNTGKARREKALKARAEAMASKENKEEENGNKVNKLEENLPAAPNGTKSLANRTTKNNFIKQSSEASSSAATADINVINDSMVTSEANKSFVTSISVGGQTEKSTGKDSATSTQSAQSTAEIKVSGISRQVLVHMYFALSIDAKCSCIGE